MVDPQDIICPDCGGNRIREGSFKPDESKTDNNLNLKCGDCGNVFGWGAGEIAAKDAEASA